MDLSGISILLVEDDPVFRHLLSQYLQSQNAEVFQAADGQQGLDMMQWHQIQLVIADLTMPVMSGLDMIRAMQIEHASVPIVVVSGNHLMDDVLQALRLGAVDYLVKPVANFEQIKQVVLEQVKAPAKALETHEQQRLTDNLDALANETHTAKIAQLSLFPNASVQGPGCQIGYSIRHKAATSSVYLEVVPIDDRRQAFLFAKIYANEPGMAFTSMLLRTCINHKVQEYQRGQGRMVTHPSSMLNYLNQAILQSGAGITMDISYGSFDSSTQRLSLAQLGHGVRSFLQSAHSLVPIVMPNTPALGQQPQVTPATHTRTMKPGEAICMLNGGLAAREALQRGNHSGVVQEQVEHDFGYLSFQLS
ncbi:response regulator [Paraferrimonas haliotis]|uniref:response regulator n=1 Tax=Paraferrimonas haliotis TaxID=2013866 RepID=UPI000BA966A7|nr:response regulator [Paraferrimonas haliotis]